MKIVTLATLATLAMSDVAMGATHLFPADKWESRRYSANEIEEDIRGLKLGDEIKYECKKICLNAEDKETCCLVEITR